MRPDSSPAASLPKIAIIAGSGSLPLTLIEACRRQQRPFHVFVIRGSDLSLPANIPADTIELGKVGALQRLLDAHAIKAVSFAGQLTRPGRGNLQTDAQGRKLLRKILPTLLFGGDNALLGLIVQYFEQQLRLEVIGADTLCPALLATPGPLGKIMPGEQDIPDILAAIEQARQLGRKDKGQAVAIRHGVLLGKEDKGGTRALLERIRPQGERAGVLVKALKPGQDRRVDLPSIGPDTVRQAQAAGLSGIAVEAGQALILEKEETRRLADALGLFVYGFTDD